ncbi:MAG: 3'-5' exonuclease [Candidatus Hodarchaeales archaeon]
MIFQEKFEYILTCDLETNGLNPLDQWLTGSFGLLDFESLETIDEIEIESKPDSWNEEAYEVHLIREDLAMSFQSREKALSQLVNFLPTRDEFLFLCHSNTNNFGSKYHFDFAVLRMDFENIIGRGSFEKHFNLENVDSTHTIAKRMRKENLLPKDLKLGLKPLCSHFGIDFKHHDAKSDRIAMEDLLRKLNEQEPRQASLI